MTNRLKKKQLLQILCLLCVLFAAGAKAQPGIASKPERVKANGYTVSEDGAWCWFADPRALHYENPEKGINATYIGYIDLHGAIKAAQYDHAANKTTEVLIRSYFQPDDHNNPTFLALPDGRIMIFYTRHTDEPCFYYRISKQPGNIATLGDEKKIITSEGTTYPSPFILSNDPNHIYLCWRGVQWHPTIARLTMPDQNDDVRFDWGPKQIVRYSKAMDGAPVPGSRPYAKYATNGKDKIYMTYTTTHPDNENPNWVYFNYINIPSSGDVSEITLTDIKGNILSNVNDVHIINKKPEYAASYPDAIVDNDPASRNWVWQVAANAQNHPVIAMVRINEDKTSHDYYYARWTGREWEKIFIAHAGGHFHQTPDIEKCYSAGMAIDEAQPNIVYCSVPVEGNSGKVYEIKKYTIGDDGALATEQITRNSEKNNVRPYIIPNSASSPLRLVWMHGDYYDWIVSKERPLGFNTSIYADYNIRNGEVHIDKNLVIDGVNDQGRNNFIVPDLKEFTIFLKLDLDTAVYEGPIITSGDLQYSLDGKTLKPYISYDGATYISANVLGNSDTWKKQPRSTNGVWYKPAKFTSASLTLTYADGELSAYVNGLSDQVVEIDGFELNQFQVGDLATKIRDCKVYSRKLNFAEITQLAGN